MLVYVQISQRQMAPRGLKKVVLAAPGKLVKSGKYTGYKATDSNDVPYGCMLRGITKLLEEKLYSTGTIDYTSASTSGTSWKGPNGGLRRGKAVDTQVSRLASCGVQKRKGSASYKLSRYVFSALEKSNLEPLQGQRVVVDTLRNIGTAIDVLAYNSQTNALAVVELKTGFAASRTTPALDASSQECRFNYPCAGATDCLLHRHLAQLAVTHRLFVKEKTLMDTLKKKFGIKSVEGKLLYVNERDTSLYELTTWWIRRGGAIATEISS